ncbi:pyrophosphate-energized membrane proton pump 2-like isoform X3 [Vigna radiata var. radiata]|nr:pyrophosphate-energized membrane proton pump 2-like isoform X3 [Vigna radiata var. radiata]
MAILLAVVILCIYLFGGSTTPQQESSGLGRSTSAYIIVASFLLGALCSGIAGYAGMWVSVRANVRVSSAAREALQVATRAGGLSALIVVGMAAIGIAVLYATFYVWLGVDSPGSMKVTDLPLLLVGYGFGASVALFAQLGGGIYTKAADVGVDLVGKVEQGIPEDDPRNPAVIITDLDEVEADVRRLRLELKQTMEMYSSACKEALTAKQKLLELHNRRIKEEKKLDFVALVAQLGCGIYTKAADVGVDHVGKVDQGIP